jgi:hypothetical protein
VPTIGDVGEATPVQQNPLLKQVKNRDSLVKLRISSQNKRKRNDVDEGSKDTTIPKIAAI